MGTTRGIADGVVRTIVPESISAVHSIVSSSDVVARVC